LTIGDREKALLLSKFGGPKAIVPVYTEESLILTVKDATDAPFVVVSGIVGVLGITVMTTDSGGGGGGGGGGPGGGALPLNLKPSQIHQPLAIVLT
jgi:hypothetical protein